MWKGQFLLLRVAYVTATWASSIIILQELFGAIARLLRWRRAGALNGTVKLTSIWFVDARKS